MRDLLFSSLVRRLLVLVLSIPAYNSLCLSRECDILSLDLWDTTILSALYLILQPPLSLFLDRSAAI